MTTPLYIASDHGGAQLKSLLIEHFRPSRSLIDLGCDGSHGVDYPDFADILCIQVLANKGIGILICGTGIGISIRANRYPGIRAALVSSKFTAEMAKAHNNANVLCLGGRTTTPEAAVTFVDTWLTTTFDGGRHEARIDKLDSPIK